MKRDTKSLAYTVWKGKYHMLFAPKYRRQIIMAIQSKYWRNLRELCKRKGVEILEANPCPNHIYMLASIPPKICVSQFLGCIKK